jgi:hypothetical protein
MGTDDKLAVVRRFFDEVCAGTCGTRSGMLQQSGVVPALPRTLPYPRAGFAIFLP